MVMTQFQIRDRIAESLREGIDVRQRILDDGLDSIIRAAQLAADCLKSGGKLLLFGNGGSAADAQHIAAEFVCRFSRDRDPLPAIALTTDTSALTAIANDYGFERVFARQVEALCQPHDVVIAISTSGRSPNVLAGIKAAQAKGARTIGLTGGDGGSTVRAVDIPIVIPTDVTARIQECHITIGHLICEVAESLLQSTG
jgi:D-sedoheptulose 7-phosphate isomerase